MATVKPPPSFDARDDADKLRKAMKGLGTNEKVLISVLTRRSFEQRHEIAEQYEKSHKRDLAKDIKSETSGDFRDVLLALLKKPYDYLAECVRDACKGAGTDEKTLIHVLCSLNNHEIEELKKSFHKCYEKDMEKVICGDVSGFFEKLLVILMHGARENEQIDEAAALAAAKELHKAGKEVAGTDEMVFIRIFAQTSFEQLKLIFQLYKMEYKDDIKDVIKKEFSGDLQKALLVIRDVAKNRTKYFAKCLNEAMKGPGTDEKTLIRIIVTRSEIDMEDIKNAYRAEFGDPLKEHIEKDTKGDFRKTLLMLIDE